jgi:hypothetical protein
MSGVATMGLTHVTAVACTRHENRGFKTKSEEEFVFVEIILITL